MRELLDDFTRPILEITIDLTVREPRTSYNSKNELLQRVYVAAIVIV